MIKRLSAVGNGTALFIDKPILELLHITMETDLDIRTDGKALIIAPVDTVMKDSTFKVAHERVLKQHSKTFKKLAKPGK